MGYYMRVLARTDKDIPISQIEQGLKSAGVDAQIELLEGNEFSWTQIVVNHPNGRHIVMVEKEPSALAQEELDEFAKTIEEFEPKSAAKWLKAYFPKVRAVYIHQVLGGAYEDGGWAAIDAIIGEIRGTLGGIIHADVEGFSNEDGYHILWEFSDDVSGPWKMAVLDTDGNWIPFEMDLGNQEHRQAFCAGKVPDGAKRL
jgi:hypothetical protein